MGVISHPPDDVAGHGAGPGDLVSLATVGSRPRETLDHDTGARVGGGRPTLSQTTTKGRGTAGAVSSGRPGSVHRSPTRLLRQRLAAGPPEPPRNDGLAFSSLPSRSDSSPVADGQR